MEPTRPTELPAPATPAGPAWQQEWLTLGDGAFWTLGLLLVALATLAAGGLLFAAYGRRGRTRGVAAGPVVPAARPPSAAPHDPCRPAFRGFGAEAGGVATPPPATGAAAGHPEDAAAAATHPRLGNAGF